MFPSAGASGAIVKCRQGKIWKGLKEGEGEGQDGYIIEIEFDKSLDEKKRKKRKKAGTESRKESSLRDWFGRKGAKGKKGGWVDCNAPDGKGGYKACGRQEGEKERNILLAAPLLQLVKSEVRAKAGAKKQRRAKRDKNNETFRTKTAYS